jgi:uncharacterized membrane protein
MTKGRLEAFSDGVLAIIITIMVLELRAPEEGTLSAFAPLIPKFLSYLLSFVFVGIYWNNHHHLLQASKSVNGSILWANMHLLFWLSLIPFTTIWMGEHFEVIPVAVYGIVLWLAGFAFYILAHALIAHHGKESIIAVAIGKDSKGLWSLYIYSAAIILAFVSPIIATIIYIAVAIMWLVPDRRIEDKIKEKS